MAQAESNPTILLFCPHCGDFIEILGERPRPLPECETCGALLELVCDLEPAFAAADRAAIEPDHGKRAEYQQQALRLWNAARRARQRCAS
jgi:hypothetical protein